MTPTPAAGPTRSDGPDSPNERHDTDPTPANSPLGVGLLARGSLGGALMGLANLVPGISGGTMLVATGIYSRFINAISDVTRLRLRPASIVLLGVVVVSAIVAIGACAKPIAWALTEFRWGMYSLFIGLTLGGAPLLIGMIRATAAGLGRAAVIGGLLGVAAMTGLVVLQSAGGAGTGGSSGSALLFVGGVAGASAMILPGVSGAYLLLLLGIYDTIIDAIKQFVEAGRAADVSALTGQLSVVVPVGLGVVFGVVAVSNLLRFLLKRYEAATLGVLLGLLLAAPLGLYPFRQGVTPEAGDVIKGETLTEQTAAEIDPKDWPQERFAPGGLQIAGAIGLIGAGFVATLGIARLGKDKPARS